MPSPTERLGIGTFILVALLAYTCGWLLRGLVCAERAATAPARVMEATC